MTQKIKDNTNSKEVFLCCKAKTHCNTFEDNFPSIVKNKSKVFIGTPYSIETTLVQECCLDKVRVREAIEKCYKDRRQTTDKMFWQIRFKKQLLKDLGIVEK